MPTPEVPKESFPGLRLAYSISSCTESTGSDGLVTTSATVSKALVIGVKSRMGSRRALLERNRFITTVLAEASMMVWPSGAARATVSAPIAPPAPACASTTTGWPSASVSPCATRRATTSAPPATVMIERIGRVGYCAQA